MCFRASQVSISRNGQNFSGPHAGVGQFSSGEVGPTLNYFGLHHMWCNLIGPHLASLLEPLTICHFEIEGTGNTAPRKILSSTLWNLHYILSGFIVFYLVYMF